jgi:hypothetical protein
MSSMPRIPAFTVACASPLAPPALPAFSNTAMFSTLTAMFLLTSGSGVSMTGGTSLGGLTGAEMLSVNPTIATQPKMAIPRRYFLAMDRSFPPLAA